MSHTPRFIVEAEQCKTKDGMTITLSEQQTKHLVKVLRKTPGDTVEILLRDDNSLQCGVLIETQPNATLQVSRRIPPHTLGVRVHLLLAQASPKALEQAVQHATECGAYGIHLFPSDYTGNKIPFKERRLALIRDSACEQAKLSHIPSLHYYSNLSEALDAIPPSSPRRFLCSSPEQTPSEAGQVSNILDIFPQQKEMSSDARSLLENLGESVEIYIAVGPEGGFSSPEIDLHLSKGFRAVSFGPYVARVETAVTLAVGIARLAATV